MDSLILYDMFVNDILLREDRQSFGQDCGCLLPMYGKSYWYGNRRLEIQVTSHSFSRLLSSCFISFHIPGRFLSVVSGSFIWTCASFRREGVFIKIIGFFDGELDGLGW